MKENFPSFQHKMCKKVARLTRVVFILNTSKDESEVNFQEMKDVYDKEVARIFMQANNLVKSA